MLALPAVDEPLFIKQVARLILTPKHETRNRIPNPESLTPNPQPLKQFP